MAYIDNRDWVIYNERLVRRGEFYLGLDFLENWGGELSRMNRGKRGAPSQYPESFAQFSGLMYEFLHLPYRQLEGALRKLSTFIPQLKAADYSTTRDVFKFLVRRGVDPPGIKIRENTPRKGLDERAFAVRRFHDPGYDKWKEKHGYGQRWASEGVFSAVKRCFGETVRATTPEGMFKEVERKFLFYNMLTKL